MMAKEVSAMGGADLGRPEPVLFLMEAADQMEAYKAGHGVYAEFWHQLSISFANGPYHLGDPGTEPTERNTTDWRPKDCEYTYRLIPSGEGDYRIRALDDQGRASYEIRAGMREPVKLPSMP